MELKDRMRTMNLFSTIFALTISASVADPLLLYLDTLNLRSFDLETQRSSILVTARFQNAFSLDFHHGNQKLYVSDVKEDKIYTLDMSVSPPTVEVILDEVLGVVGGIAVDWINNNLYWTDSGMYSQ